MIRALKYWLNLSNRDGKGRILGEETNAIKV
jgi:hypothetical protein